MDCSSEIELATERRPQGVMYFHPVQCPTTVGRGIGLSQFCRNFLPYYVSVEQLEPEVPLGPFAAASAR